MADGAGYDSQSLLMDEEEWLAFLEEAFRNNSGGANTLALLLFTLKNSIETAHDLGQAINTLLDGIRLTYLYTEEHKLALKLYMLHLTGHLKPQDEPFNLLNDAIERGVAEIERSRKKRGVGKLKHTGQRALQGRR
ncbi:MAG: hypothetical protein JOZ52_03275 [Acidobacteria bacterium]|nr:hypothetical protein [Acidobacteriota bacterium]